MDFAFAQIKIYIVIGQHTGKSFGNAFSFKNDGVFGHVISRKVHRQRRAESCGR